MTSSPPSFSASSSTAGTYASDLDATAEARGLSWRSYAGLPVLLLALHAVLAWIGRSPGILTRQDDARYLVLARALRHGQYRDLMWPDAPPHHLYPPGYPALLAIWTAIGGEGFDWLIALHILMSVATLALAFLAMRKAFGPTVVLCALAVLAVNPSLLEWAGQVASESSLALAIALAVYAATCLPEGTAKHTALALAALSAPFMRTAGIVVPVAVVLYYVAERQYKRALVFAVCSALVLVPLLWWTLNDPYAVVGSSYAADLRTPSTKSTSFVEMMVGRARSNFVYYMSRGFPWVLPTPTVANTLVDNVLGAVLLVVGSVVGVITGWRRFRFATLLLLMSGGLLVVWAWQVSRYLVPLLPILVPVVLAGLLRAGTRVRRGAGNVLVIGSALAIAATACVRNASRIAERTQCERGSVADYKCLTDDQRSFFEATAFVRDSLPPAARILSAKSEPLHYFSGHITVPAARLLVLDSTQFWKTLQLQGAEFLLLGDLQAGERTRLAPLLGSHCASLELVRRFPPRTYLFRVLPTSGRASGPAPSDASSSASAGAAMPTESASAVLSACDAVHAYRASVAPVR